MRSPSPGSSAGGAAAFAGSAAGSLGAAVGSGVLAGRGWALGVVAAAVTGAAGVAALAQPSNERQRVENAVSLVVVFRATVRMWGFLTWHAGESATCSTQTAVSSREKGLIVRAYHEPLSHGMRQRKLPPA